jgi:Peptidase family M48
MTNNRPPGDDFAMPAAHMPARSLFAILGRAWNTFRGNAAVLIGLQALFWVPLSLALSGGTRGIWGLLSDLAMLVLVAPLCALAGVSAASGAWIQGSLRVGASLRVSLTRYVPIAATLALTAVLLGGLSFILILPGLYFLVCWSLAGAVVVVEGTWGIDALARSYALVRGRWLFTFGALGLSVLPGAALAASTIFSRRTVALSGPLVHLRALGWAASSAFASVALVVLYTELRARASRDVLVPTAAMRPNAIFEPPPAATTLPRPGPSWLERALFSGLLRRGLATLLALVVFGFGLVLALGMDAQVAATDAVRPDYVRLAGNVVDLTRTRDLTMLLSARTTHAIVATQLSRLIALPWLSFALMLLWARFDVRTPRLRPLLPELVGVCLAWQAVSEYHLPLFLETLEERVNRVLQGLPLAESALQVGRFGWWGLALLLVSVPFGPARLRVWQRWLLAGPGLLMLRYGDVGAALCCSALILLVAGLLDGARGAFESDEAFERSLSRIGLAFGAAMAALCSDFDHAKARLALAGGTASVALVCALELAAVWRRRRARRSPLREPWPSEPTVLDGRVVLSPFVIPNEARLRTFVALAFGLVALAYHAQLIVAVISEGVAAAPLAVALNAGTLTFLLCAAPFGWVVLACRPGGSVIARYAHGSGLVPVAERADAQDYDDALFAMLAEITASWRPTRPFTVHRIAGFGSPTAGWSARGNFVELPSATLDSFFLGSDRSPEQAKALLAHEVAHLVHGDPAPLFFATAVCSAAVWMALVSGVLFVSSSVAPWKTVLPPGRLDGWLLMLAVALGAYGFLLRGAQRKIELLADARAALALRSVKPLQEMVEHLLRLEPVRPSEDGYFAPRFRLCAAPSGRAQPDVWQRLRSVFDTHERLDRRLERLRGGMHVMNPPDAMTLFAVSALAWLPLYGSFFVTRPTWSPLLMSTVLGALGLVVSLLEYWFLAALVISPRGGSGERLDGWKLRLGYLGGSAFGIFVLAALSLARWPHAASESYQAVHAFLATSMPARRLAEGVDLDLWTLGMLAALPAALVLVLIVPFLAGRALLIALLQRLARTLLLGTGAGNATLAVLGPFLGAGFLFAFVVPIFASEWMSAMSAMKEVRDLWRWVLWPVVGLGTAAFGMVVAWALCLWRRQPCCAQQRVSDARLIDTLYRGCAGCGRPLAPSLVMWQPELEPRTTMVSFGRGWWAVVAVAAVLAFAIGRAAPDLSWEWKMNADAQKARRLLEDPSGLAALKERARLADLRNFTAYSLSERLLGVHLKEEKSFAHVDLLRTYAPILNAMMMPTNESAMLADFMSLAPAYEGIPADLRHVGDGVSWLHLLGGVDRVLHGSRLPASPHPALAQRACSEAGGAPQRAHLDLAYCQLLRMDLRQAATLLGAYEPIPSFGPVGIVKGLSAAMTGDAARAIDTVMAYAGLCDEDQAACPGATKVILSEIVTLAVAYELKSGAAFKSDILERRLEAYGLHDQLTALRWHLEVRSRDPAVSEQARRSAAQRVQRTGKTRIEIWRDRDMVVLRERFASADAPLRGEPAALSKPVSLLTDVLY